MSTYYYVYPFAVAGGNTAAVPTEFSSAVPPGAGLSYQDGYTVNYEQDLLTTPTALPISRGQMNQLFFDITNNLQYYQQHGSPQWVPAASNLGVPLAYDIYAKVRYNVGSPGSEGAGTLTYVNQVQGNTATPGADQTWFPLGYTLNVNVPFASSVTLTSTVRTNVASLALPAGTWSVSGNLSFTASGASTGFAAWLGVASAAPSDVSNQISIAGNAAAQTIGAVVPTIIVTGPLTVYLIGQATYAGTTTGCGNIVATALDAA